MKTLAVLALAAVAAAGAAGSTGRPLVSVTGAVVSPGAKIVVRVSGAVPGRRLRLYLRRWPLYMTATPIPIGNVVPSRRGSAQLTFRLAELDANVYAPAACCSRGNFIAGHGLLSVPAVLPAGFGPLGAPGCTPASPRNRDGTAFAQTEVFGTAVGAQLWALGATVIYVLLLWALVWIGRGDFTADEWEGALEAARDADNGRTSAYLLGTPNLGDELEEGMAALGLSCADVEREHL